jgi:ABC-type Fe3+/spermidine/putrescine transport system ATPase subunit
MSDLVVVMNKGKIEQMGAPAEVYEHPQSEFVANFLGNANFLAATVAGGEGDVIAVRLADGSTLRVAGGSARPIHAGEAVKVVVRAEKVVLAAPGNGNLSGRITDVDYLGALARYEVELTGGQRLRALSSLHEKARSLGESVGVGIDPEHCRIL